MTIQNFCIMFLFMIISSFTPGPGNLLALDIMIKNGWKKGQKLIWGILAGYMTVQYICTFAVIGLNAYLSSALRVLKYVGAIYLIWLAIHFVLSKPNNNRKQSGTNFLTGYFMQLVNIKIYFYITTLLSGYIIPSFTCIWKILLMGLFVVLIGSSATLTWAFAGLKLKNILNKHEKVINIILAVLLILCAVNIIRS